ncbi:alcohol dehydrogenase-like protein [Labedella gwakjiensis]|uniref:Alcohol dehydrogenase-like protein n=1 Tax=Labedella gwakjiensis TaxID=390269 RepID=A0A2P8GUK2_9MICO|nr:zinc-binding alcohol dehydrogenase family protein [Labedella gwakjiensis]PSL37644.1 alcohol dehydrogenase-like protein [Labedella gwakjiensis]RUQ87759.1 zinc-binding alcohol dehydrogenase family protein [Labedella gwakjiensis]
MTRNTAAWIDAPYADVVVRDSPYPAVGPGQLLVRVRAVAVNPLDAIVQSNGRLMYRWLAYPAILGEDVSGEVVAVGPGVERFAVADRIVAYAMGIEKGRDAVAEGGFQEYVVVEEALAAAVPERMSHEEAAVLPLAVSTAAAALFEVGQLALPVDGLGSGVERGEVVVIWGGATSVGGNAIQLARAAGYRVITTASPRNHERLLALGAAAAFDYRDPAVVDRIVEAVGGSRVAGVVAIAVGSAEPCVTIAARTGARRVALTSPSVSFYDQPRRGGFSVRRTRLLVRLVASNIALQSRCAIRGVRARFVWGSAIADSAVGSALWRDHLPTALAAGTHRPYPAPRVVGDGLASVQTAIDLVRGGVSAEKLVVTL